MIPICPCSRRRNTQVTAKNWAKSLGTALTIGKIQVSNLSRNRATAAVRGRMPAMSAAAGAVTGVVAVATMATLRQVTSTKQVSHLTASDIHPTACIRPSNRTPTAHRQASMPLAVTVRETSAAMLGRNRSQTVLRTVAALLMAATMPSGLTLSRRASCPRSTRCMATMASRNFPRLSRILI